jgi:hypothetical protein
VSDLASKDTADALPDVPRVGVEREVEIEDVRVARTLLVRDLGRPTDSTRMGPRIFGFGSTFCKV